MGWTPKWNAKFVKPLVNQTIAIIQKYQASALAAVNAQRRALGNPVLDPIREYHKGPGRRMALPYLTVAWDNSPFNQDEDLTRTSDPRIVLVLDVGQADPELAQDDAADYALMIDQILTTAWDNTVDWETALPIEHETVPVGTTSPNASGSLKWVFVEDHRLSEGKVTVDQTETPVFRITMPVLFHLIET
jgi:hypothetical protein